MQDKENEQKFPINDVVLFSSFYIIGVISFLTVTIPFVAVFLLVLTMFLLAKKFINNKTAVVIYSIFAIAIVNCHFQIKNYDSLSEFVPSNAVLKGTVENIPTTNNPTRTKFYLNVKSGVFDGVKKEDINARTIVTLYGTEKETSKIKIADEVELTGKLMNPLKAKNPSQFDYSNYLRNHGVFSTFYVKNGDWKIVSTPKNTTGKFLQKLNDKRNSILSHQSKYMKPNNIEVLGGIVFGDDAINPPDHIKKSFINSGLLHILAASGMNVSIIFGIWFFIGVRLRINYRLNIFIGALLVAFYTLMTGMGPSVLRAAFMIEFVLLGKLIDRATDSMALVFFVAFLMLAYNPAMICDIGFQLSFVVTFALLFYCPAVMDNIKNKWINFLVGAVLIPFVAQLWASPIQMFYFNSYATYSVFANFAITLFIMVISFLGFVCSILVMIPVEVFADKVCLVFSAILNPVVSGLISISDFFSNLPHSLISTFHPHILQISLYYSTLVLFGISLKDKFYNKKLVAGVLILLVLTCLSFVKITPKTCDIIVFDVGNADSFLIKTPQNKYLMIDTAHGFIGGKNSTFSQADSIMNKYLKDNGVRNLEVLLLTHFDSDHSGGAVDVMETVNVKKLILNKEKDNSATTVRLFDYLKENKFVPEFAQNNKIIYAEDNLVLKTFTPDFVHNKNDNDNSTIALLSYNGFDMLFMADGGVRSFNKVKNDLNTSNIEILKSGHHGAQNTVSTKMLKTINPDAVLISTGLNNYGHPHKETLNTIVKNGIKVYRTDTSNALKISVNKKSYRFYKYNTEQRRFEKEFEAVNR